MMRLYFHSLFLQACYICLQPDTAFKLTKLTFLYGKKEIAQGFMPKDLTHYLDHLLKKELQQTGLSTHQPKTGKAAPGMPHLDLKIFYAIQALGEPYFSVANLVLVQKKKIQTAAKNLKMTQEQLVDTLTVVLTQLKQLLRSDMHALMTLNMLNHVY